MKTPCHRPDSLDARTIRAGSSSRLTICRCGQRARETSANCPNRPAPTWHWATSTRSSCITGQGAPVLSETSSKLIPVIRKPACPQLAVAESAVGRFQYQTSALRCGAGTPILIGSSQPIRTLNTEMNTSTADSATASCGQRRLADDGISFEDFDNAVAPAGDATAARRGCQCQVALVSFDKWAGQFLDARWPHRPDS